MSAAEDSATVMTTVCDRVLNHVNDSFTLGSRHGCTKVRACAACTAFFFTLRRQLDEDNITFVNTA